jgi:hypothetical protein
MNRWYLMFAGLPPHNTFPGNDIEAKYISLGIQFLLFGGVFSDEQKVKLLSLHLFLHPVFSRSLAALRSAKLSLNASEARS